MSCSALWGGPELLRVTVSWSWLHEEEEEEEEEEEGGCDTASRWWRSPSGDIWTARVKPVYAEQQMVRLIRRPDAGVGSAFPPTAWL